MTFLVYLCAAVAAAALGTRGWSVDPHEPNRRALLVVAWLIALGWAGFALSLLDGAQELRSLYTVCLGLLPFATVGLCDRILPRPAGAGASGAALRVAGLSGALVALATCVHLAGWAGAEDVSPAEIAAGALALLGAGALLYRLWDAHEASPGRVARARLRYLLAFTALALAFTYVEQIARVWWGVPPVDALGPVDRTVALQGAVPPFSVLFTGLTLYLLHHTVASRRLLDLHELFSRLATLATLAAFLTALEVLAVVWSGARLLFPAHAAFQSFLVGLGFIAAYDPLRDVIGRSTSRLMNRRGTQLTHAIAALRADLPSGLAPDAWVAHLLDGLNGSGRVPVCSIYLWDPKGDGYVCAGWRGPSGAAPLARVAARPFADAFIEGEPYTLRHRVARRQEVDATSREVLSLLDAMHADLTLPFVVNGVVMGWIHLQDEPWSDGYSDEELRQLAKLARVASAGLASIRALQAAAERDRLAALGQMAAGLAHEIRNPLAGIKGAAQVLEAEDLEDEAQEMLGVVVREVDRLNLVVTQFLDYARPFVLQRAPDHVNAVATSALVLLRAQGVPASVRVEDHLAGDLPNIALDRDRLLQVLLNLLQNALQAMPSGGVLTVTTRAAMQRGGQPAVEIAVADTGVGIPPEDVPRLFIPFWTTKDGGTGLGLAISQRIVSAHDGEMDVQSSPGVGSTFIVRLPISARDAVTAPA
jgi:two-component system sensor histidine kinase HydH